MTDLNPALNPSARIEIIGGQIIGYRAELFDDDGDSVYLGDHLHADSGSANEEADRVAGEWLTPCACD